MKIRFFIVVLLSVSLRAFGVGGCFAYWNPNPSYFRAGGSITVNHADGTVDRINALNYDLHGQYSLSNTDYVYVYPPDCGLWTWGYTTFCVCNNQQGITCGNPEPQQVGSATYKQVQVYISCGCPNGTSDFGMLFVYQRFCQAGGGGGQ